MGLTPNQRYDLYIRRCLGLTDKEKDYVRGISEENLDLMRKFHEYLLDSKLKVGTRCNYIIYLYELAKFIGDKSFKSTPEEEERNLRLFFREKDEEVNVGTSITAKVKVRKFYQWLYDSTEGTSYEEDETYPKCTKWMKKSIRQQKKGLPVTTVDPSSFLTQDEFRLVLQEASLQQTAMIMCMRFGGLTVSEALALDLRDVIEEPDGYITLDLAKKDLKTKWRRRRVTLREGSQEIRLWKNKNQYYGQPDKQFFYDKFGRRMTYFVWHDQHQSILNRVGIKKDCHSHLYRHMCLTDLVKTKKLPESALRKFAGWSPKSTMPSVYVHLEDKDVTEMLYGKKETKKALEAIQCDRCRNWNMPGNQYCSTCGLPLVPLVKHYRDFWKRKLKKEQPEEQSRKDLEMRAIELSLEWFKKYLQNGRQI